MSTVICHLSLKIELLNSKIYSHKCFRNNPLTVIFINQVGRDILSSHKENMELNVGNNSMTNQQY